MSLVDENMRRSRERDAIVSQKFFFRTNMQSEGEPVIEELYLREILFGKENFVGIQGLLDENRTLMMKDPCSEMKQEVLEKNRKLQKEVVEFVRSKVEGERKTLARWIREFVLKHPEYKQDSVVTHSINYDLINTLIDIKDRKIEDKDFPPIFSI